MLPTVTADDANTTISGLESPTLSNPDPATDPTIERNNYLTISIDVDQKTNNSWYYEGSIVEWDNDTDTPSYTRQYPTEGTFNITIVAHHLDNSSLTDSHIWNVTVQDTTGPSITNIQHTDDGETWINWTWSDDNSDGDYDTTMVFLNGTHMLNTTSGYYNTTTNITNLQNDTSHTISLQAVDTYSNTGSWNNDSVYLGTKPSDESAFSTDTDEATQTIKIGILFAVMLIVFLAIVAIIQNTLVLEGSYENFEMLVKLVIATMIIMAMLAGFFLWDIVGFGSIT